MMSVLVSVESFPRSTQVWDKPVCVAIALVLPDSSIEGEHLVVLPIGVKLHVSVLVFLAGQVGSFSPVLPIAAHVLLLGVPRHCSTS